MSTTLSTIIANFSSTIAGSISVGGTTGALVTTTDIDGVTIPNGLYTMLIDRGTTTQEHIQFTLTGENMTGISHVSAQGTVTSGTAKVHSAGAIVELTDFVNIREASRMLQGIKALDGTSPVEYDAAPTFTEGSQELITVQSAQTRATAAETAAKAHADIGDASLQGQVNTLNTTTVKTSGNQSVDGVKTFSVSPVIPDATASNQPISKNQFDAAAQAFSTDASTTVKGVVEIATPEEVKAGTASGGTSAELVVTPEALQGTTVSVSTSSGSSDAGKIVKTNANGKIDDSLTISPSMRTYTTVIGNLAVNDVVGLDTNGAVFRVKQGLDVPDYTTDTPLGFTKTAHTRSTTSIVNAQSTSDTSTFSYTVQAGTNRMLCMAFYNSNNNAQSVTATYNGNAMTKLAQLSGNPGSAGALFIIPMGTSGSSTVANIVLSSTGDSTYTATCFSIEGAKQTTSVIAAGEVQRLSTDSAVMLTPNDIEGFAFFVIAAGGSTLTNATQILSSQASYDNYNGTESYDIAFGSQFRALSYAILEMTETASIEVQFSGVVSGFSGLSIGKKYYLSAATVGAITATPPGTNITMGLAISSTEIAIK